MFDAELRELSRQFEAAVAEYDAVSERLGVAVERTYASKQIGAPAGGAPVSGASASIARPPRPRVTRLPLLA
jgi:hypothetical protein